MKRTAAIALMALAVALANVRPYSDVEDSTIGNDTRSGLVVIIPSHDLCYGLEFEHGTPSANGWAIHHVDTFGGPCE